MSESSHMASLAQRGEEVLEHYGRQGMKWGRTIFSKGSGSANAAKTLHVAKVIGKTSAKIGVRVGAVAALSAVGVPTAIAGTTVAATLAANPELVSVGKDYAKLALDDYGIINMGAVDQAKATLNVTKFTAEQEIAERTS